MRGLSVTYGDGHVLDRHVHPWGQLVYAARGVMRVRTADADWLVPPTRAIWAPGGCAHEIRMQGKVALRTLYMAPRESDHRLTACRAVEVSPLLRELILHVVRLGMLDRRPEHRRLEGLLVDLLAESETAPLALPMPKDSRARAFADRLLEASPNVPLTELTRGAGASLRTLQRLFQAETQLTLEAWRGQARMQHGLAALAEGASVTEAGLDAGYQSPSAFIAAFKRTFGVTPARYRAA